MQQKYHDSTHLYNPGGDYLYMATEETHDAALRRHLTKLLNGGEAHISFDDLVEGFPVNRCGKEIEGLPYTAWQVLEHLQIAQFDIIEFARNADYSSPEFPDGYWPKELGNEELWGTTVTKIRRDLEETVKIVSDPSTDLFARIPHGTGQTWLRQAMLVADHNAYHIGTLAAMKRLLK